MRFILDQAGRFWWWIQQGGNSNIVLVAVTAWYSWLTFRILQWSSAQTKEQLRPSFQPTVTRSAIDPSEGHYAIENVGERSSKILDALLTCYVDGDRYSRFRPDNVQGVMLPAGQTISGIFPMPIRTDEWVICTFRVVGSDHNEQVFGTYEYWSNVHKTLVSGRRPLRVVLRMWMTPIRMPYFKITRWSRHSRIRKVLLAATGLAGAFLVYKLLRS